MGRTLREFVKSILSEGVKDTGMSTREWLKANKGVDYTGSLADSRYYVYTDDSGNEIVGNIMRRGDPYTYEDVGGGKIRVASGPEIGGSSGAIGVLIDASDSAPSGGKDKPEEKDGSRAEKPVSQKETDKSTAAFIRNLRLGMSHLMIATYEMKNIMEGLNGAMLEPRLYDHLAEKMIGKELAANVEKLAALADLDLLGNQSDKKRIYDALRSDLDMSPLSQEIDAMSNSGKMSSSLKIAEIAFKMAAKSLSKIDASDFSKEQLDQIGTLTTEFFVLSDTITSDNTIDFIRKGLLASGESNGRIRVSTAVFPAPVKMGDFHISIIRSQIERYKQAAQSDDGAD